MSCLQRAFHVHHEYRTSRNRNAASKRTVVWSYPGETHLSKSPSPFPRFITNSSSSSFHPQVHVSCMARTYQRLTVSSSTFITIHVCGSKMKPCVMTLTLPSTWTFFWVTYACEKTWISCNHCILHRVIRLQQDGHVGEVKSPRSALYSYRLRYRIFRN